MKKISNFRVKIGKKNKIENFQKIWLKVALSVDQDNLDQNCIIMK